MDSRRARSSRMTEEELACLVSKLQTLLPDTQKRTRGKVSSEKVLKETCDYIRSLRRSLDDLSEKLSQLLETLDSNSTQAEIIRTLIRQ